MYYMCTPEIKDDGLFLSGYMFPRYLSKQQKTMNFSFVGDVLPTFKSVVT